MTGLPCSVLPSRPSVASKSLGLLAGPAGRARRVLTGQWHAHSNGPQRVRIPDESSGDVQDRPTARSAQV